MNDSTNFFTADSTNISQIEYKVKELKSEIERIEDRVKELESEDRGFYVGYLAYVTSSPDYWDEEYRQYHVFGNILLSEAHKRLGSIDIGNCANLYSSKCIELSEDIFNLFKICQQLTNFKRDIDRYAWLPQMDRRGDVYGESFNNVEPITNCLDKEIKRVCTEIETKMKARGMWFDEYAEIY